jgi:ParB family chromosome partitioning protein
MVDAPRRKGLGRGLAALIDDVRPAADAPPPSPDRLAPIDMIAPNPDQPRRRFADAEIAELAESIRAHGVIQPLIVRPKPDGRSGWQIVAGERRWRAAQQAGLHDLPIIVKYYTDQQVVEVAIIENIQRADLNPIEEAAGYQQLMQRFGHTQETLARSLGRSRSHIANAVRLLSLAPEIRAHVESGALSAGHARCLIGAPNAEALARRIVAEGLTVRQAERLSGAQKAPAQKVRRPAKDADTAALEADLSAALGMAVTIDHRDGGGRVEIRYVDLDQLDRLCGLLGRGGA